MEETLPARCFLWHFMVGPFSYEFVGDKNSIYHFPLGISGVYAFSAYPDLCPRGIKVFIFQFPYLAPVHGIGPIGSNSGNIEFMGPAAYFFVGGETNPYFSMLDLGILDQIFHGRDDLGNSSLVVGTQEGGTVGSNEGVSFIL